MTESSDKSKIRGSSVLSSRGQVVVPREIREAIGATQGDIVVFETVDKYTAVVHVEKKPTAEGLFGVLESKVPPHMRNQEWDDILQTAKTRKAKEQLRKGFE